MDNYVTRSTIGYPSSSSTNPSTASTIAPKIQKKIFISDVDLESLEADPEIRKPIAEYNPNIRDDIRRYYILKKPCKPKDHKFPKTKFGKVMRQFFPNWFKDRKWLEYSITKDVAFCLCCYLFKNEYESRGDVVDAAFTKTGFRAWNKATERFRAHVGDVNSIHNKCFNKMLDFMNQSQSIRTSFDKKSKKEKSESRRRLSASVDVTRFLLKLGLSFRGHDESRSSSNRGIFLELLQWDLLRKHQAEQLEELLISGEVHTGRGFNQEHGLQRPVIHVLEFTGCECPNYTNRLLAKTLVDTIKKFDFAFMLHLMWKVLMMTNELSSSLQRMDQDIVNAMGFLALTKQRLQNMRDNEFESLMDDVSSFCDKHDIVIPEMNASYFPGKSKLKALDVTYSHHLRVEIFYVVIDLHLRELNNRFDVVSTDLLLGMASLNPVNSFGSFDKGKLMSFQLDSFIVYARGSDERFFNLKGISDLAKVLIKSDLHQTWPLVYLLIKLTLILPVATASVERAFSSMKYIKNELCNSIGDEFLNGCLVCYVERKIFANMILT
ncbi:zinc finger MYM-type protein 1-like [Solanum pennellii]|uniref:Zinc finger MYM-type protein 1-like n=1 Tax=Solanum pennellii TaxID=28526 RepID=A0ABM1GBD3_SOLPN|nr:zinc finger MYM-type protein 1-like [Solanum pennellii]